MPREFQEPTVEKEDGPHHGYIESHPCYALAGFNRTTGLYPGLFGSSIAHNSTISLTIRRAVLHRNMYSDYYHGREELIEVRFSPTQFAELISTMNCGMGVPCTLEYHDGKVVPEAPPRNRRAEVQSEFKEKMQKLAGECDSLREKIKEMETAKRVSKQDIKELKNLVERAIVELRNNIPFAHECFNEACDNTVAEAKGEVDASLTAMIHRMGGEKLAELLGTKQIELTSVEQPPLIEGEVVGNSQLEIRADK